MTRKSRRLLFAAALVGVAALVLCIVMSVHTLQGGTLAGCGAGASCDDLMTGRWSKLFGIFPVSAIAAGVYLAFLFCIVCLFLSKDSGIKDTASLALRILAGAILGSAVWFIGLQLFAEGEICRYCMAAHGLGILASALALLGLPRAGGRGVRSLCAGAGLALLMAVIQLSTPYEPVYQAGKMEEPLPLIGTVDNPVVGNPDAEYVIDLLYDYQCSHCQRIHGLLQEVSDAFGGRVAFVLCPCPLSPKCNPYVPREEVRFEGSCELARLALAVYHLDPQAFPSFDAWLFGEGDDGPWRPRSVADARERAEAAVGAVRLDAFLSEPALTETLRRTTDLFGRTSTQGNGGIPRFVYGNSWAVPATDTVEGLTRILSDEFGIN